MSCQDGCKESLLPAVQELERARDFLSAKFFDNKLNDIVITIQTKGRKNALGWFGAELQRVIKLEFKLQDSVFSIFRREQTRRKKQETKMKKWVCLCGVIVRCAVELNARCEDCGELFVKEDS